MYRPLFTSRSIGPHHSMTVVTAAPSDAGSRRSAATARAFAPAASISAVVELRLPGSGVVFDLATVEECSRCSPSCTVRAVMATSNPFLASCLAMALPIPLLAPVTNATGRLFFFEVGTSECLPLHFAPCTEELRRGWAWRRGGAGSAERHDLAVGPAPPATAAGGGRGEARRRRADALREQR